MALPPLPPPPLPLPFIRPLPSVLVLLRPVLRHLMGRLLSRHPEPFERLGPHGHKRFLIDPVDMPVVFTLMPDTLILGAMTPTIGAMTPTIGAITPTLDIHWRGEAGEHDATIAGPLAKLIGLVNGTEDGDALFFSRDLRISGDTEAVLALRNVIEDMDTDLWQELASSLGPLGRPLGMVRERAARWAGALHAAGDLLSATAPRHERLDERLDERLETPDASGPQGKTP